MKYLSSTLIRSLAAVAVAGAALFIAPDALAQPTKEAIDGLKSTGQDGGPTVEEVIQAITNLLLFIVGAAAVIFLIYGGIQYVTSGGDEGSTKSAKNTILYAIVGIIIAVAAYAIVNFVLDAF